MSPSTTASAPSPAPARRSRPAASPATGAVPARPLSPGHARRLLLLDGHSLAYRAFFALPVENFSTTTGQLTNAVYGFTSMLINVLRDEQPTHVAVAFDVSRPDLPQRGVRRVQGQPHRDRRRSSPVRWR